MDMSLKLDWCDFKSAKWAVENWHYSRSMPAGKLTRIGVWEDDKFIGCVIFSRGAAHNIGKPFSLRQTQVCELTRVALKQHNAPVTKIVSIAIRMLSKLSPGLKLIVSYADPVQNHKGIIYKAGNWIELGDASKPDCAMLIHGKRMHRRSVYAKYGNQGLQYIKNNVDPNAKILHEPAKIKFIYPLDKKWYSEFLRQQSKSKTSGFHSEEGGAVPTLAHQEIRG